MSDLRPKWAIILDELIAMAEQELKEVEKGAVPTAPSTKNTQPSHLVSEVNNTYD